MFRVHFDAVVQSPKRVYDFICFLLLIVYTTKIPYSFILTCAIVVLEYRVVHLKVAMPVLGTHRLCYSVSSYCSNRGHARLWGCKDKTRQ